MVQIVKALRVLFSVLHPHPWFELRFGRVDTLALAGGGAEGDQLTARRSYSGRTRSGNCFDLETKQQAQPWTPGGQRSSHKVVPSLLFAARVSNSFCCYFKDAQRPACN